MWAFHKYTIWKDIISIEWLVSIFEFWISKKKKSKDGLDKIQIYKYKREIKKPIYTY